MDIDEDRYRWGDQDRTIPERPVGELDDEDAELELRLGSITW